MDWIKYLIIPIIACSWIGVFLYKKYALYTGIISNPNYRTLHELPIPRGGGVASLLGFIDDIKSIRARIKLIIQLLLSSWVLYCLYLDNLLF